jgi:DNA-binding MarR family transcriptional regulator
MVELRREIMQGVPFASREEEAFLSLLRTADCLQRDFHRRIRSWGITLTQYNVLRILRGAQPRGLTCSAIGARVITAVPDITRLLARLKKRNLICQQYDSQDRRVVWTQISATGLELLEDMDPVILKIPGDLLANLKGAEVEELVRLLELARNNAQNPPEFCQE